MEQKYLCTICDKSFPRKKTLEIHLNSVHADEKIPCPHCDANFSRESSLMDHINGIHQKIVLKCNYCDRKYKWKHDLRRHTRHRHTEAGLHENVEKNVKIALFILKKLQEKGERSNTNMKSIESEMNNMKFRNRNWRTW